MARPILIIKLDPKLMMSNTLDDFALAIESRLDNEYYVLPITVLSDYKVEFEVLNADKANKLDIEKLKKDIKDLLECPQ